VMKKLMFGELCESMGEYEASATSVTTLQASSSLYILGFSFILISELN